MGHTEVSATHASSVTLYNWQNGAKENYCNFASFNKVVDTKTSNQNVAKNIKLWLENESKQIMIFGFLRTPLLISKDQKESIICTMGDVRGDFRAATRHNTSQKTTKKKLPIRI